MSCSRMAHSPTHPANAERCSTPDPVLGTWVMDTKHLHLFGTSGLIGKAVKEEKGGSAKGLGELREWRDEGIKKDLDEGGCWVPGSR